MAEKHVVTINGETYNLPPWNAGQMRNDVDPMLLRTKALMEEAMAARAGGEIDPQQLLDLSIRQREMARAQSDLVLAALRNQYPHLALADLETLTPGRIAQLFNEILLLATSGAEPGEPIPPALKKRHR